MQTIILAILVVVLAAYSFTATMAIRGLRHTCSTLAKTNRHSHYCYRGIPITITRVYDEQHRYLGSFGMWQGFGPWDPNTARPSPMHDQATLMDMFEKDIDKQLEKADK